MNPPRISIVSLQGPLKKGPFWEGSNYAKVFRTHSALFGYAKRQIDSPQPSASRFWGHFRFGHRRLRVSFSQSWSTAGAAVIPWCVAIGWWLNGLGIVLRKPKHDLIWMDGNGATKQPNPFSLRSHPTETSHLHHFNQVADVCWYPGIRISRISRAKTTAIESTKIFFLPNTNTSPMMSRWSRNRVPGWSSKQLATSFCVTVMITMVLFLTCVEKDTHPYLQ